jgi:hypothetical protein
MLKKNILIAVTFLILSCNSKAQEKTPSNIIDTFFKIYNTKGSNEALDFIFLTNKFIEKKDVELIKERVTQYAKILGKYHNQDLVIKKSVGSSIEVYSYILKYERQPIKFLITFYKPSRKWKLQNFKINDNFIEDIEKAIIQSAYKN